MNLNTLITSCPDCNATLTHTAFDDTIWAAHCHACGWTCEDLPAPLDVRQALERLHAFPGLLAEVVRDLEALSKLQRDHEVMRLRLLAEARVPAGFPVGWAFIGDGIYQRVAGALLLEVAQRIPNPEALRWRWRIFRGHKTPALRIGDAPYLRDAMLEADEMAVIE